LILHTAACRDIVNVDFPEQVLRNFLEPYPRTSIPSQFVDDWWEWAGYEEKLSSLNWDQLISNVNLDATPGVPYCQLAPTNAKLLESFSGFLQQILVERLDRLMKYASEVETMSAYQLVVMGLCDPVRVFIKNEVHAAKKVETGKVRLICSVSIVDQLVERLLFSEQNRMDIKESAYIPSKPGFGLLEPHAVLQLREFASLMKTCGPLASTDMSTWDFTMQEWEWRAEYKMRCILNSANPHDSWSIMARSRMLALSLSVYCLSDGRLYSQSSRGIMKSGSYLTSSTNSRIRALCAYLRGSPSMTMGDDCVEVLKGSEEELIAFYSKLGHVVKDVKVGSDTFEFCSHLFTHDSVIPVNWMKMTLNFLLKQDYSELSFRQFDMELKDLNRGLVRCVLDKCGVPYLGRL
jgi:hypothetical protein